MAETFDLSGNSLATRLRHLRLIQQGAFVVIVGLIALCTGLLLIAPFWIGFSHPESQEIAVGLFGDAGLGGCLYGSLRQWRQTWGDYGKLLVVDHDGFTLQLQTGRTVQFGWRDQNLGVKLIGIDGPRVLEHPWIELDTPGNSPTPLTQAAREALLSSATAAGVELTRSSREEHGVVVETTSFKPGLKPRESAV